MTRPSFRALACAGILSTTGLSVPGQVIGQAAEGIKVHGHWVIEVRDPDGGLQQHREFENALTLGGKQILARLLLGFPRGDWSVGLVTVPAICPSPGIGSLSPSTCLIGETGVTLPTISLNLLVTSNTSGPVQQVLLRGSFVAPAAAEIRTVGTNHHPALIPGQPSTAGTFTSADLATPIPVQATQSVSVAVTIGFE